MKLDKRKITDFQNKVLTHYEKFGRDLPRRQTNDPYEIFVSEIMSQQTQVNRVVPKYHAFLEKLPNFESLASIDKPTLLSLRSGLGYNNRALRMQQCAVSIIDLHGGKLPNNYDILIKLPGIGDYTANALLAFAYNQEAPVVDINIKRVLITFFNLDANIDLKQLKKIALQCIPAGKSHTRHNALMDYGAMILTPAKTGIKSPKQSKFKGSKRRVRGSILKELVKNKTAKISKLKKSYSHKDFDIILEEMKKEKLIDQKGETIQIQQ